MGRRQSSQTPLLGADEGASPTQKRDWGKIALFLIPALFAIAALLGLFLAGDGNPLFPNGGRAIEAEENAEIESENGVVAADDGRCSQIGASVLRQGGHAVDAAVATVLCLGVVNAMASGIGGGGFMVVRSSSTTEVRAFDMRETAPFAATKNMYTNNIQAKYLGPLSMGVPGEIAGLYEAWQQYGRLPWKSLFQPAIKLAKDGFVVAPYLALSIAESTKILDDPGLQQVFAPNNKLLKAGDLCYNAELARTLEAISEHGPEVFYNGSVGENLVKDARKAGGIIEMEDLQNYKVRVTDAVAVDAMGYTVYGMPSPSSGTLGMSLVMNIFKSYGGSVDAAKGGIGLHRLIESLKHMFALRMNLGDPDFVDISEVQAEMLSPAFGEKIQKLIFDNTTFPPEYYMHKWSQLRDHGTSHLCIVDGERNAVSMTTTVNYGFGAGLLSPSTGIVINNEMGDFSAPTEISDDQLPPSPANFIEPNKRPLSSMTPIIVTKGNQLAGVLGGSGGLYIIPAIVQVFLNHFVLGMKPLHAVLSPRVYHDLIPNVVKYENWTLLCGDHIELAEERKDFLRERGHQLNANAGGAIVQLVVQSLQNAINRKTDTGNNTVIHGMLTAVSDLRKDGRPAAV
ncbi:unnamed protein product [Linum tenue]|uniref:Glutathione hydrolase n=1 Tax=Linum tenue TaxID=586396 RepID=A0AAV0QFG4_9ROSI|nr:unnamed protein product [Linum tenue]CAI0543680.1 unnamed protein product [Linum tenue]